MTVAEIQSVVAMYLQRSVAKFDVSGTGANLLLVAMNNARKYAERKHNWAVCRQKGYLSVTTSNRVAWDSPTWFDGGTEKMKEAKHWWLRDGTSVTSEWMANDVPLKVIQHGVKHVVETRQNYESWGEEFSELRQVREDSSWHPMLNQPHGVISGKWLELYPRPTTTNVLIVDGYKQWANWTSADQASEVWSGTLPTSVFASLADESYLYVNVQTPVETRIGVIALDDAGDGTAVSQLGAPYGQVNAPTVAINASAFTKENVKTALVQLGFDASLTTDSVKISISGEPSGATVQQYSQGAGAFIGSPTLTFSLTSEVSDSSGTTDWWTENAEEFLILRSLVEGNRLGQVFTGNKEGNLPSPEKQAEQALQDLISQDCGGEMAGGQVELY